MTDIHIEDTFETRPVPVTAALRLQPWLAESRALARLSLPLIATQLAHMAMPTTDILMLGALGQEALAAAALANTFYVFAFLIGLGPASAIAPVIAQIVGANPSDRARTRIALRMGLWAILLLTLPLGFTFLFVESALVALGQTPELARAAAPYAQIMAVGLPFALGFYVMRNFATALGRPNAPLAVMLCAVPLNVVLDYGLIFGELGLPELGLYGAAIATSALNAFAFITMLAIATFSRDFRPYRIWRRFHRADWARLAEIFRLGASIGLTMVFEVALFAGSTLVIGHFGVAAVAAHNIAMNIPSITFMVPLGIAMAATVRVGYAVGARDRVGVRRAGLTALVIGSAFMLVCSIILAGFPRQIVGLYLDLADPANDAAVAHAVSFLYAVAAFQVLDGIQVIAAFALRGLKDVRAPMILAGISYWVIGFPLMLFLAFGLGWNGIGVWIALAGSLVAAAALLFARFLYMSARR